ncbi:PREDICTED: little elongation complex subunit 1 isoform X1 [Ceratotherium simum simum]|uniref:Little elongation complex subunit 1 isoform X1 n=1 Tax=Ceratotherium simum simum TaxID=73337 RepID=A0ABM0I4H3_CERSS|nr:PREDICTED: little elongation complex subunit 1 isoform X1 [Ceratotherium simum simum]
MMPGETHSAAPGTAADLSRCQGCASLQQNLNEYVEALITLKQKIINTDNLLTEYQKKCDELQFARRENSTLHHQVEQMLQKISPLQKCQEELGSLKAELEEKKSSLKLYQDTHQEYTRVKEECLKTDAQKKKLEAKVKKLEEAAVKQTQDFKQLKNEKKILEKEFKKTQERLDEFSKQKNEKELRHIGTQISSDSYGSIDKRKVKLLLKELWLCINTTHRLPGEGSRCVPEKLAKENPTSRESREDGISPPVGGSPLRASAVQTCLAELSMEIESNFSACKNVGKEGPGGAVYRNDRVLNEDQNPEVLMQRNDDDSTDFSDPDHFFDEDLQAAVDFFKLPPPLLSPVPSPPLVSLPHLGALPSSLAPETYFGEYTDSSDNDSAQHRNSAKSVSEDETPESQDCFGSPRKTEGSGTREEMLKSHEATQTLSTFEVNEVTAVGFGTFTATLREPSTTYSLAHEKHWTVSSEFMNDRKRGILDEAKRQREVREMDKSVQTENTLHKPTRSVSVEKLSGSLVQEREAAPKKSDVCYSPLVKMPLNELTEYEGKTRSSKMVGSPTSDFTRCTLTNEITSELGHISVSDHFQGLSGGLEKERDNMQGFILGESPESEEEAGHAMEGPGLDVEAKFSSSSTSEALSVCSNSQSSSGFEYGNDTRVPTKVIPAELHSEQKLQAKTLHRLYLQSEPPECSTGEKDLETSFRALSPILGASNFNSQSGSEVECTKIVKGITKVCSLPQSIFMKATKDGQCESQDPRIELTLSQSDFTSLVESRSGLIKSGFGFVKSTSWHHSDLLRRGGEERLRAKSEHEQKANYQLQQATLSLENRGSTSTPELAGGSNNAVGLKAAASLLPNQVSVITKQARPETVTSARSGHLRPHRNEPALATGNVDNGTGHESSIGRCGGEREDTTWKTKEAAAAKRASPEVPTSWRKLDFDSPSGSLPVGDSCSTNSKLSFSSDNVPIQNREVVTEAAVHDEVQQGPCLHATNPALTGVNADKLLPATAVPVSGGFPVEEMSCGDTVGSGGEALAISEDSPSAQQSPKEPLELPSQTPGSASEALGTTGPAFSSVTGRKDEETRVLPQSSLPGNLYCYTGIREAAGGDTEVEESEAPSCSEGENEPEAVMGNGQQGAVDASGKDAGAVDAGVAETRPSIEVGYLTSALQDFNISTFSEIDTLSTSEVVMFLESCQLRDYSSGDSVSECSSKGTLNKDKNKDLRQSEILGEKYRKLLCEEETLETSEEWMESEEDDCPLRDTSQLTQCSLETLSEVLTKIGQELQTNHDDSNGEDAGNLLLLDVHDSMTREDVKEQVPPQETAGSSSAASDAPPPTACLDAQGSSPSSGRSNNENTEGRPEGNLDGSKPMDSGEEGMSEPAEPSPCCSDSGAGQTATHSADCEAEATFQCQIATVTSEVINVLINKDQKLVIENGDNWTIINGVALMPNVDQVILCGAPGDVPVSPGGGGQGAGCISVTSLEKSPETSHPGPPFEEPQCGSNLACTQEDISSSGQSTNFDKSRLRNRPVKPSVRISSQIYDQNFESPIVASDHTYYNSKLEPFGKYKNRSKVSNKDQSNKLVKTLASSRVETNQSEVSQSFSGERGNAKTQRNQTQTILANADTSTPTDCSADTLSKIRQEVGPPLPPLLAPLIATPPRTSQPVSPLISSSSPSSPTSPVGQISPLCEIPVPPMMSPLPEDPGRSSLPCTSPSPSAAPAGERILSSPLQFCAATPKHALPVPGRLPPFASTHTAVAGPQENSVKILDTMYPELSARARTLNILKGNIQLTRSRPADCKHLPGPVSAITGFKTITSTSTAFVKTGSNSGGDCNQEKSRDSGAQQDSSGKRTLSVSTLRSAKRLRLDSGSPEPETGSTPTKGVNRTLHRNLPPAEVVTTQQERSSVPTVNTVSQLPVNAKDTVESHDKAIADALKKISESSFDLLPVIRSHVYVGNISKKPVMRDQEKEVVYEFSTTKKHLAECLLHSVLSELKVQKTSLEHSYIHALCRVYVGVCRQLGDLERARLFCYSLLKEDFPESEKLTLFIANMWHDVFISQSVINKAMQLVARQRAKGEVLNCLRAFLNWEKNAPVDVGFMVSKLLLTIQLCPNTEFQSSEQFGEDLSENTWEYVLAIDLLCCHQKWVWTHDHIISKELWPVMDKWIKYRKGHANIAHTPDVIIASVLRLIGRLGQLGLKEGFPSAVKNISSVIGMFIQHAQDEDIPWGIQLAAVYALCDLSPSNPAEISKILEAWRRETSHSVPSAVVSALEEVSALCAEELG